MVDSFTVRWLLSLLLLSVPTWGAFLPWVQCHTALLAPLIEEHVDMALGNGDRHQTTLWTALEAPASTKHLARISESERMELVKAFNRVARSRLSHLHADRAETLLGTAPEALVVTHQLNHGQVARDTQTVFQKLDSRSGGPIPKLFLLREQFPFSSTRMPDLSTVRHSMGGELGRRIGASTIHLVGGLFQLCVYTSARNLIDNGVGRHQSLRIVFHLPAIYLPWGFSLASMLPNDEADFDRFLDSMVQVLARHKPIEWVSEAQRQRIPPFEIIRSAKFEAQGSQVTLDFVK